MFETLSAYWPHILVALSIVLGVPAAIHATMTKEEVRAAIGWVGVIMLSPVVGPLIYAIGGVNRIRRKTLNLSREGLLAAGWHHMAEYDVSNAYMQVAYGRALAAMQHLGDTVGRCKLTSGNRIHLLSTGDEAYAAMLAAIATAERSILLETYIFDRDPAGERFVAALSGAVARGVQVRVLIDAVGARYSIPSIVSDLQRANVPVDVFNGNIVMGLRLPYANLRTHRKILIVDGSVAFTGGLNIRAGFCAEFSGEAAALDTHFRLTGPAVSDLFRIAYEDWRFSGGDELAGEAWQIAPPPDAPESGMLARVVPSGPDKSLETNHRMLMGALSIAKRHIRIMSPYFLPDRELISAIVTAARRGVEIDIVVPSTNNLKLVDLAMTAQFDQMLKHGCRIWRASGAFNHSKLTVIDGAWSYIGSSNIDPRSLRLNFEVDIEVIDADFADLIGQRIAAALSEAEEVKLDELRARPFAQRLVERITWLGSPYL
ncbi:phosphatidylserine/phosphatidylglycerophosphate/cardiolipin synthase family protein [Shinella sp. JR1-6]|uniref:phospholipase D-like domain-containing protein n=1 Tax=Shinella sp. JR1-6 TaxID=2527671 RepID=UPI00102D6688|nr:phosphatidylserine/phosphatidylglycerophosphate/cardiolipin synthase family protein [Shinella sp. JR1-6]TAA57419.1 phosphatidylserine/phosphatidylglycerophosphate/cardiolipin synthase family protein [Shinella sp. JR1-6]